MEIRKEAEQLIQILEEQERVLQFDSFCNADALELGYHLAHAVEQSERPVAIRVFLNNIVVFQYTMNGKEESHYGWTEKKNRLLQKTGHSSMHGCIAFKYLDELEELGKEKDVYGFGCGSFPISVKNQGIVGAVCMSGLADPEDHVVIVRELEKMTGQKAPEFSVEAFKALGKKLDC